MRGTEYGNNRNIKNKIRLMAHTGSCVCFTYRGEEDAIVVPIQRAAAVIT